jgi:hypothetical protein
MFKKMPTNLSLLSAAVTGLLGLAGIHGGTVPRARAPRNHWRDKVSTEIYRHFMITSSPKSINEHNAAVVARKDRRHRNRMRRQQDAQAALKRTDFDTLTLHRKGLRNYCVEKAGG